MKIKGLAMISMLKGVSYSDIAKKCGVTRQAVSLWATVRDIPEDRLEEISEILSCPKNALISEINSDLLLQDIEKYFG